MDPKNDVAESGEKKVVVVVKAPDMRVVRFTIRGTAPYVQHAFGEKARKKLMADQEKGSQGKKEKKQREPKDFDAEYENAKHYSADGWIGIPASGFRSALISACRMVDFAMTRAKISLFIIADGFDRVDSTPLIKITKGTPRRMDSAVRLESGVVDIHARPMWDPGWEADLAVRFDHGQFSQDDVTNLLLRAGLQVGIGEGRPDSKKSAGCGWGTFEIVNN